MADYIGDLRKFIGRDAKFFSLDNIPLNLSSPIKGIIEEFILKYRELKKQGII